MPPTLSLKTQVWRFIVTGGFSAIVDFGLYVLLCKAVGPQVDLAKAISFIVGTITAWMSRMGMALDEGYIVLYRSVVFTRW